MSDVTFFAKTNFRNQEKTFGIKTDDRRRHVYVIGKTGMGKTNLLEHLVIQDIRNGHGVCYIDPHGDTSEKIIKAIPSNRVNDVIYFNPADQDYPIAMNVMEKVKPEHRHLVSSGLVSVFQKLWADSWGPRLEYILRNAILALLEYPGSTLLGVMKILVDKRYRQRVVEKITDPVVKSFWIDEFPKWNERVLQEVVSPIQNKVGQFLTSSLIRNIVGQTKSSFDVRNLMDERKILILNLSKGRIGEDISRLLGAMMITKIQLAAMERVDIPEEDRKDFYLYVDEFQNFATEAFINILSEARKYRLNLTLANQYVTQFDETVRDAIFGNVGTLVAFRVGAVDAEFMEKEFEPAFMMNDLVNLPKYHIYLKLMIDGVAGDAFSATTLPPVDVRETEINREKVIKVSRERYASGKEEVEDKIKRWSEGLSERVIEAKIQEKVQQQIAVNNPVVVQTPKKAVPAVEERELYDAVCDTCGIKIQVPFRPDGQRPTFCKDCLKDYQRVMARSRTSEERITKVKPEYEDRKMEGFEKARPAKTIAPKAFVSSEEPLSLSQLRHMAPKKFKPRPKPQVNLEEVRKLINKRNSDNGS